ncbi:hypothetical protein NC653_006826 [Populus alba x Populus x berolinensis]|uniref:Uncharacterized protein n=1 Tax=Populus alba x Populus x berolinensis TaxID=444605 RepID=A0AAD6WDJ0_9ROSI|nr:hypothetical protein NC653_006826 [Populus alba x Populus x berolinensis]
MHGVVVISGTEKPQLVGSDHVLGSSDQASFPPIIASIKGFFEDSIMALGLVGHMLQLWLRSQNEYILQRKGHVQCEDVQARKGCTFSPCLQVSRFFRERDTKLDGTKDLDMEFVPECCVSLSVTSWKEAALAKFMKSPLKAWSVSRGALCGYCSFLGVNFNGKR